MPITKTLGGDRLGSGNRMKVEMHNYERSTHDLGKIWRSSMAPGPLVPFLNTIGLPGDTWDIDLATLSKTLPTTGPLFGSYKLQLDILVSPVRLYNGLMHNNTLNIGRNMTQAKLPLIRLTATNTHTVVEDEGDIDNCQMNPSSILPYLGIRGVGSWDGEGAAPTRTFNCTALLVYWDIYKNYYANKQEEIGAVLHTPSEALVDTVDTVELENTSTGDQTLPKVPTVGVPLTLQQNSVFVVKWTPPAATPLLSQIMIITENLGIKSITELSTETTFDPAGEIRAIFNFEKYGNITVLQWRMRTSTDLNNGSPTVVTFALTNLDQMRNLLLINMSTAPVIINDLNAGSGVVPYKYVYEQPNGIPNLLSSQEGLGLKCYQSDIFNNWLNTEWIDGVGGITDRTSIDTSGGSFTIDTFITARKVYDILNRIAVSDGTLDSWQEVVYGHRANGKTETPMYMGGLIKEIVFTEVVSNSQSEGQPLGTLAGKGTQADKHKGGKVILKIDEICVIMGIVSITPRIDYSQGNSWEVNLTTVDDFHKPGLDGIGFQELINEKKAWWSTNWNGTAWVQTSVGKQPAWLDYMTNFNTTHGDFAIPTNAMFMTLNRRFEARQSLIPDIQIADNTTYIDPSKYNFIFAQTNLDAQNFWIQIAINATVRRKMSAKLMPNL